MLPFLSGQGANYDQRWVLSFVDKTFGRGERSGLDGWG